MTDPTSSSEKTTSQMAPEQGQSSKSDCVNIYTANTSELRDCLQTYLHPNEALHIHENLNWIYKLKKDQLIIACEKFNIKISGHTVSELRKLLSDYIKQSRLSKSTENLFETLQNEIRAEEEDIIVRPISTTPQSNPAMVNFSTQTQLFNDSTIASQARAWNITYNGNDELYAFLSKVEGKAENVGLSHDLLIPTVPYILTGTALQWYEVQAKGVKTWEEFRSKITNFFLPTRHLSQIESMYHSRRQRPREKARDYILDLLTLARQHPDLKSRNHLDRLYDGLLPDYKLQICRDRVLSIDELASKCNEYDQLKQKDNKLHRNEDDRPFRRENNRNPRQTNHSLRHGPYSSRTHCWRCKLQGHKRIDCKNKRKLFCSRCGTNGTLSRDCPCNNFNSNINCTERMFITVGIKDHVVSALVDTGASQTYVTDQMLPKLKALGFKPETHQQDIQVANQEIVVSSGLFLLPITYKNKTTWQKVIVLPKLAETIILGIDFLTARNFTLSIDGQTLPSNKASLNEPPIINSLCTLKSHQQLSQTEQNKMSEFIKCQKKRFSESMQNFNA